MPLEHNGLVKLSEECGELVQACMKKIARSGGENIHWDGSNLKERLEDEIADVMAACQVSQENLSLDKHRIGSRRLKKAALFRYWHDGGTETTLPQVWCSNCGGDKDEADPCEVCNDTGLVDQVFDSRFDVEKQEEIVSDLWEFARCVTPRPDETSIRKAVSAFLPKMLEQLDLEVMPIQ